MGLLPVYRTSEVRRIEESARAQPLMERAGQAAAGDARTLAGERGGSVLVLAGPGNNGGDAFVVARILREAFFDVTVVFRGDCERLPKDATDAYRAFVGAGGTTIADFPDPWHGSLIVDGLFGIGLARPLSADFASLVERANVSGIPILALDIPSGIDADTGVAKGAVIRAQATSTFIALKPGLLTGAGLDCCGDVSIHSLYLEPEATAAAMGHRLDWSRLAAEIPAALRRQVRNVHKGTFGTLAIVGGADGMVGAPLLAGRAALHTGAGKVWIGLATGNPPAVDWGQPELMLRGATDVLSAGASAVVCGPGIGTAPEAKALVVRAIAEHVPLVLDADALNTISADPALAAAVAKRSLPTLVTPHPAEAARLLGTTTESVQADRLAAAHTLAAKFDAHVVVKGAGSVLAHPDGAWDINASGNAGLASAGTGDVLAGFAGAFLAQGIGAAAALRLAVCLHGAAGDACVAEGHGPLGLAASELPRAARALLNAR
jgi:ADP-dependent NAD(P)H-hydrate dehydratase / NAD(P)H-hydrate epimerase